MNFANNLDALILPVLILFVITASLSITMLGYQYSKFKKRTWPAFAKSNRLNFETKGSRGKGAYIVGNYRGHRLILETIPVGRGGYLHTRISLSMRCEPLLQESKKDVLTEQLLGGKSVNLHASNNLSFPLKGQIKIASDNQELRYIQFGTEGDIKYLQFLFDLLTDFAEAYPRIIATGGEAVKPLKVAVAHQGILHPIIHQMLKDIGQDTTTRLKHRASQLLCPRCLSCFGPHKTPLFWPQSVTYYGCRTCGQSREFFEGWLVAVLDSGSSAEQTCQDSVLRVNWLLRDTLFDFDEIEIVQATDEEVERFVVTIGNDTDPVRRVRYKEIRCIVSPDNCLSENTIRILKRMFGQVVVKDLA